MTNGHGRTGSTSDRPRDLSRPVPPALSWSILGAFAAALAVAYVAFDLPAWVPGLYVGASIVTFATYGIDKAAAKRAWNRVSERTLLLLGLVGGWPGALVAQQVFRHKTRKRAFRRALFGTVVINVAVLAGAAVLRML